MELNRIAILGLGLIGGSLAKALKRTNPRFRIAGYDLNEENLNAALSDGAIDSAAYDLAQAAEGADLIWICTPVHTVPGLLTQLSSQIQPGTLITDAASTKGSILQRAAEVLPKGTYFIGGHPMAGTERSGFSAALAHLFENAYYLLVPLPDTPLSVIEAFSALVASTGALPLQIEASLHDRMVGAVSHLPHVVAAALVQSLSELEDPDHMLMKLAAGGFKDITRIASSNPAMWKDISLSNRQQLLPLISAMIRKLYDFGRSLESGVDAEIEGFYSQAKAFREQLPPSQSLYQLPYYELYVDVEDKPGIIGYVATLLGSNGINIKNIRIINSREEEPGCLVLSLPSLKARKDALSLLLGHGCHAYER